MQMPKDHGRRLKESGNPHSGQFRLRNTNSGKRLKDNGRTRKTADGRGRGQADRQTGCRDGRTEGRDRLIAGDLE
jgi:hypothetical protein